MKLIYKILLVVIILVALFLGFNEYVSEDQGINNLPKLSLEGDRWVSNLHKVNLEDEFASYQVQNVRIKGKIFQLYLADTDALRAQGLSGKSGLPERFGMMFTFPQTGIHPFWMKDMKFPLDIMWVRNGIVVEIWENAPLPQDGQIPLYEPKELADEVYEFPAGFAKENGIKVGDQAQ